MGRLAENGVIHGDFNEFNIMITPEEKAVMIDFPQMISTNHPDAKVHFDRDVQGIVTFFRKRFGYDSPVFPVFDEITREHNLDKEIHASGFTKEMDKDIQ